VRRFRVELTREGEGETRRILAAYRALVAGELQPSAVVERAGAVAQVGVGRGAMRVMAS
jgi:putative protease